MVYPGIESVNRISETRVAGGTARWRLRCTPALPPLAPTLHFRYDARMETLTPAHVQAALDTHGLGLSVIHYDDHTTTSEDAARVIGCRLGQIAKSMCLMVGGQPALVVAYGDRRIAEAKLARHFEIGRKKIRIATADQCVEIFGYAPGGVAPVGHRTPGIPVIVDESLGRWERIYAAAGTPHDNFELTFDQLCSITGGTVLDCTVETHRS